MSTTIQKQPDTLEKIGESIQKKVLDLVDKGGQPAKKVKNALDGVWLGHAIHPILVALPIGSWTLAATADLLSLADEKSDLAKVSDTAVAFGLVSAIPTALTGLSNWVDMDGDERKVGTLHLLLNDAAIAAYVASWLLRKQKGQRKLAVVLSTAAYLTMSVAGYFGGELAYRLGAMVNRNAWNAPLDDWTPVLDTQELAENTPKKAKAGDLELVLIKQGGKVYAIGNICSHMGGPLDEGKLEGDFISCPWHASRFCIKDGSVEDGPATFAQPLFAVRDNNGKIEVKLVKNQRGG